MDKAAIGIVGLGAMGQGIAQVFAGAGHRVIATDAQSGAREAATGRIADGLARRVEAGRMTVQARDALLGRISVVDDLDGFASAAMVVEAIAERIEAKRALFAQLEAVVAGDAILASNTSSLAVSELSKGLNAPDRVLGLHFFNPAPVMKLVELIGHSGTAAAALARARTLTEGAGKTVINAPDRPGFIVNRCARPFYGEALALLDEGHSATAIDGAMLAAGYRLGPFALIDLVGADINLAATDSLSTAMGGHPRYHVFAALRSQVAQGALGRKTGQGFVWPDRPESAPDPDIALRIEAALINEGAWLLAEGAVTRSDIDTGLRLGLNFPRGPFELLAAHGAGRIRTLLAALAGAAPEQLRGRYDPAPLLAAD